jgi:hypothetical protein
VPEGLSGAEVGKEIAEHSRRAAEGVEGEGDRRARLISISEAIILSLVAILAAYSGYTAARWSTESSVSLASASAARTKANRAVTAAMVQRNFDASTFNAWFTAYIGGNRRGMALAARRFSPQFKVGLRRLVGHASRDQPARAAGAHVHARIPPAAAGGGPGI